MNVFESNVYLSSCQADPDDERLEECEGSSDEWD